MIPKQFIGITFGMALLCAFLPPLLSGSNHTCPVLREKDMEKGPSARAVPAFARKYNVDCTYCHTAWPQLNRTGYIFRRLGYRMPWEVPTHDGASAAPSATAPGSGALPPGMSNPLPPATTSALKQAINTAKQPPSPERIAEGQKQFTQMQCFTCHANGGNLINPGKPIKGTSFLKKYSEDAQIAQLIRRGVAGTAMPAYSKERLGDEQLNALIDYVRSLTPPQ